jgi:hypothetical protein
MTKTCPAIIDAIGIYGLFFIFASVAFFAGVFASIFMPETKGPCLNIHTSKADLGSISPTFYARLFRAKVSGKAFLGFKKRLNFLLVQRKWHNCAKKC